MRIALAALALCLCACGSREEPSDDRVTDRWLDGQEHAAKAEGAPVEVFVTQKPTRPYREIAIIRVDSDDGGAGTVRRLRQRTREMGGDACIVTARGVQHHHAFFIVALGLGANGGDTTEAVVITYAAP